MHCKVVVFPQPLGSQQSVKFSLLDFVTDTVDSPDLSGVRGEYFAKILYS